MRELLVEKFGQHTIKTYLQDTETFTIYFFNKQGYLHRYNNLPAHIHINRGIIVEAAFYRNGVYYKGMSNEDCEIMEL